MALMPQQEFAGNTGSAGLSAVEVDGIYREYGRDLLAFLMGVLKDVDAAHDALQQTFQRVTETGATARQETLRGWLFQVAYNEAMHLRRQQQRDVRRQQKFWGDCRSLPLPGDPSQELIQREIEQRLAAALNELPQEQRDVVERRLRDETTFAQIAAETGTPLGTVMTRMRLAVERLRKQLRDDA